MRRIIIMSGPAKLRIPAIIGVISMLVSGKLFFTYSTNFLDLYSRSVICGVVWSPISVRCPPFRGFFLREWNKTRPRQSY